MHHAIVRHARSNLVGYLALFVALGGTSYAAISIPRGSVGATQIRNHSITPVKFNRSVIAGSARAWAIVGASGNVIASGGKPKVTTSSSIPGRYGIQWGLNLPRTCSTVANIDSRSPASAQTVITLPGGGVENVVAGFVTDVRTNGGVTGLDTLNQAGHPMSLAFDVAVIC
jgi:hypothetical protein